MRGLPRDLRAPKTSTKFTANRLGATLTFDKFTKGDGVPAPRAVLESGVTESIGGSIEAYAFAPDFCDKTLTTCEDALK